MMSAAWHLVLGPALLFGSVVAFPSVSSATPPVTPGEFRYEIYSDTTAELFWSRTTDVAVRGYELTRNGVNLGVLDALSYVDHTLSPGNEYTYALTAVATNGERSGTSAVSLRTPRSADTIASLQRRVLALEAEVAGLESRVEGGIRSPVPRTGQTVVETSGDDGDFQAGIAWPDPRFTANVGADDDLDGDGVCDAGETCDGTVTDNLTGLVWLQNANCFGERSWFEAIDAANALANDGVSGCGLNDGSRSGDWRLPNVKELQSLMDYGHAFPTPLLPEGHPFSDVQIGGVTTPPSRYWSSTSTGPGGNAVYSVSISVGWVERLSVSSGSNFSGHVWPVRN